MILAAYSQLKHQSCISSNKTKSVTWCIYKVQEGALHTRLGQEILPAC